MAKRLRRKWMWTGWTVWTVWTAAAASYVDPIQKRFSSKRRLCVTPGGAQNYYTPHPGLRYAHPGLLCCWPFGPPGFMTISVHNVHSHKAAKARRATHTQPQSGKSPEGDTYTATKRQKPGGRHIEAQGKPGRQARRSPGGDGIDLEPCKGDT
jgi:hypothetical protein